jgi:hypothetical protein
METKRNWQNMAEHRPELDGNTRNILETTILYKTQARLTPTLTHVVTYELVTSGAEDDTMSTDRNPFYPWSFHYGEFKIHLLNLLLSPSLGPHGLL